MISGGRLFFDGYIYYDGSGTQSLSHFSRPLDLSVTGQVQGPFAAVAATTQGVVSAGTNITGEVSGPMTAIPPEWQTLLGGPAILTGNSVQVTGAGPVTLQANQPGDAFFLPAPPANQTFNVIAAATLKYRGQSRTLLRDGTTHEAPPYVLEKP